MDKKKSLYAIYKYDFHKAIERTIQAEADGIERIPADLRRYERTVDTAHGDSLRGW